MPKQRLEVQAFQCSAVTNRTTRLGENSGDGQMCTHSSYRVLLARFLSILGKGPERYIQKQLAVTVIVHGAISQLYSSAILRRLAIDLVEVLVYRTEKAFEQGLSNTLVLMDVLRNFNATDHTGPIPT